MRLQHPAKRAYVCAQCSLLNRRTFTTTRSPNLQISSEQPPSSGIVRLTSRRLLALHGRDATHFLQGLVTANMRPGLTTGLYAAFLTGQGRVLNDVFIYPAAHSAAYRDSLPKALEEGEDAYLIEVDAEEASKLLAHLKKYKLRAKITLRLLDEGEWSVWSAWSGDEPWTPHPSAPGENESSSNDVSSNIGCVDARAPGMGRRIVVTGTSMPASSSTDDVAPAAESTLAAYTVRRMLKGVPEGQGEIQRDHALPQESNIDYMGGIDFRKGCYSGQELTIRTHHTGVVRKRILPCMLYDLQASSPPEKLEYDPSGPIPQEQTPPAFTNIMPHGKKGRSSGKWIDGVGNIGLGLVRIEMMTDMILTGEGSRWTPEDHFKVSWGGDEEGDRGEGSSAEKKEVGVKAFVPDWIRSRTKIKTPNPKV